jgi:hypothetical protein
MAQRHNNLADDLCEQSWRSARASRRAALRRATTETYIVYILPLGNWATNCCKWGWSCMITACATCAYVHSVDKHTSEQLCGHRLHPCAPMEFTQAASLMVLRGSIFPGSTCEETCCQQCRVPVAWRSLPVAPVHTNAAPISVPKTAPIIITTLFTFLLWIRKTAPIRCRQAAPISGPRNTPRWPRKCKPKSAIAAPNSGPCGEPMAP